MSSQAKNKRVEFGDFQTPQILARGICALLARKGFTPASVIEPTCGMGSLLFAALDQFPSIRKAMGFDINPHYVERVAAALSRTSHRCNARVEHADFFATKWPPLVNERPEPLLAIGNPPWVTNAALGALGSSNLPVKSNFQNHRGMDAITGKSNFDISESMMLQMLNWLNGRDGVFAFLCKTAVARKVLAHAWKHALHIAKSEIYGIDALSHFGASVDACLMVCMFSPTQSNFDCAVFSIWRRQDPARFSAIEITN